MQKNAFFLQQSLRKKQYTIGTHGCPFRAVARSGVCFRFCRTPRTCRALGQGGRHVNHALGDHVPWIRPHSVFRLFAPSDEAEQYRARILHLCVHEIQAQAYFWRRFFRKPAEEAEGGVYFVRTARQNSGGGGGGLGGERNPPKCWWACSMPVAPLAPQPSLVGRPMRHGAYGRHARLSDDTARDIGVRLSACG